MRDVWERTITEVPEKMVQRREGGETEESWADEIQDPGGGGDRPRVVRRRLSTETSNHEAGKELTVHRRRGRGSGRSRADVQDVSIGSRGGLRGRCGSPIREEVRCVADRPLATVVQPVSRPVEACVAPDRVVGVLISRGVAERAQRDEVSERHRRRRERAKERRETHESM